MTLQSGATLDTSNGLTINGAIIRMPGAAWIRTSDYQIRKIRTDLLTPLRPLTEMTTVVDFADVSFKDSPTRLMLPKQVQVQVRLGPFVFANRHKYSDYRKFRVKSVIKAGP